MNRVSRPLKFGLFVLLLGTCGMQIGRVSTAAPVTTPLPRDALKAERSAVSRVGGDDVKAPLPDRKGLVGGNGVVEPAQRETRVAAQVSAVVERVLVKEGGHVKAGDVLVKLASGVEQAAVAAAEADLAAERASLLRAQRGVREEDREALEAEAAAARARADLSTGQAERAEKLARSAAITADELERARRQAQADQAAWKALDARHRAARAGTREEDVTLARARVAAAEARVVQARAAVARLSVKAPYDAEILQVKVREGELYTAQAGEPLLLLGDTRRLRVRVDVDERDVARVAAGAEAHVMADAFGERKFPGTVVEIGRRFGRKNVRTDDPVEKNDTKVLEVVVELVGADTLVPGQRVTAFIQPVDGNG